MSDEGNQFEENSDDVYVIDDTGESLEEFKVEDQEAAAAAAAPASAPAQADPPSTGGDASLREENQKLKDQVLRSRADFENFRKRAEREKTDFFKYALAQNIRELLPVVDNFERALATDSDGSDFRVGVEMIYKQMSDVLAKMGLHEVPTDLAFNPTMHEAVMREEREDVPAHTILQVLQKGYMLHDRLLRPALVKVSVGGPDQEQPQG